MPATAPDTLDERKLLGRALQLLRERAGLTQAEAAEEYGKIVSNDDFTPQAWGMYETGKRAKIFDPVTLHNLTAAVKATVGEITLEVDRMRGLQGNPAGVSEERTLFLPAGTNPSRRQTVFTLPEGDVVLSFPTQLSEQGEQDLADYLQIFLRNLRRGTAAER